MVSRVPRAVMLGLSAKSLPWWLAGADERRAPSSRYIGGIDLYADKTRSPLVPCGSKSTDAFLLAAADPRVRA